MPAEKPFLDYLQFSIYLLGLCRQSKNGTIFLINRHNNSGLISLENGKIVGIGCKAIKGRAALGIFRTVMRECTFRFTEQLIIQTDTDLPDELTVLQCLDIDEKEAKSMLAQRNSANRKFSRSPFLRSPILHIESRAFRAIIERNAIDIFGPAIKKTSDKYLNDIDKIKTLDELRWLLRLISNEVGDDALQDKFLTSVLQHLGLDMRKQKRND